jgi:hypothetical protein
MSLIHKQEMTEENLAAHRANGAQSQGAVTPEGKANSAAANLRHGFYCRAQNGALTALGGRPGRVCRAHEFPHAFQGSSRGTAP